MGGDGGKFVLTVTNVQGGEVAGLGLHQAVQSALDEERVMRKLARVQQGDEDKDQDEAHGPKN